MRASWALRSNMSADLSDGRAGLPRLYELLDSPAKPNRRRAYRQAFESDLVADPDKFAAIESDLASLDAAAWTHLKSVIAAKFAFTTPRQGWLQAGDIFHEAKAYRYLIAHGYEDVMFLPAGATKTPDLQARHGTKRLLCEVKTVVATPLTTFRKKLASRLVDAQAQLDAFADDDARRLIFVVLMLQAIPPAQRAAFLAETKAFAATVPSEVVIEAGDGSTRD